MCFGGGSNNQSQQTRIAEPLTGAMDPKRNLEPIDSTQHLANKEARAINTKTRSETSLIDKPFELKEEQKNKLRLGLSNIQLK